MSTFHAAGILLGVCLVLGTYHIVLYYAAHAARMARPPAHYDRDVSNSTKSDKERGARLEQSGRAGELHTVGFALICMCACNPPNL